MKVLLVDDEKDFLEQAKLFLKKENKQLKITTATSAEKALEILQKDKHDIVVSDYKMPEMDGLEFLETLRERDENIPFIVLTGKGREEVAMDALNLGADRYLQKGEDPESLYRILSLAIIQETQRKKALEKIRASEKKYKTIFESTGTGMVILEDDMTISLVNKKFEEITGYAQKEIEGKKWTQLISDEDLKKMKKYHRLRRDNPDAAPQSYRFTYTDKEGNEKTGLMNVALIPNTNKSLISTMDVTERSEMEKRIRKSEREKKLILNSASEAIAYLDKDLKIKLANQAAGEVVGKDPEDLKNHYCYEIWHERNEPCENCPVLKAMKTDKVKEQEIEKFDHVWLIRGAPVKNEKGEIIGGVQIGADITERKKIEEKLNFESGLLKSLLNHIPDSIYFKDKRARFVRVSDSKAKHLGVEKDEIIGKTDFEFYPKEQAQEMFEDDIHVIEEEEPIVRKEEKVTRPGGEERWVSATKIPRYNEEGDLIGTLGISRDITERKKAREREEFLNSLLRHDFKTKTQICRGYLDLLEKTELSSDQEKYLKKTEEVIQSEMDLVEKVSKLKKVEGKAETKEINLDPIIKDAIEKNKLRAEEKGIKIEYEGCKYSGKGGELLKILFSNLIENSIKHSEADLIKIRAEEVKDKIVAIIEDNGEGIPDGNKEKIFQKGFKKGRNAGSGLGTHLAKKIAEKYEGSIEAKDSEMGGARFDVQIKKTGA